MLEKVTVLRIQDFPQNSVKENIKENISSCGRQRLSAASALDAYKRKRWGIRAALPPLSFIGSCTLQAVRYLDFPPRLAYNSLIADL